MSLENNGLEIIKFTKVKNRDINLKKGTNYLTVIRNLEYNDLANVCAEENQIHEILIVTLGIN